MSANANLELIESFSQIAAPAGLAIGTLLLVFRELIDKIVFKKIPDNKATMVVIILASMAFGVAIVGISAWAYVTVNSLPDRKPEIADTNPGTNQFGKGNIKVDIKGDHNNIGNINTGNFGLSLQEYEAGLKLKERELREELTKSSLTDKEKSTRLEKELEAVKNELKDTNNSYELFKKKVDDISNAIDGLKNILPDDQIKKAKNELARGETKEAKRIFISEWSKSKGNSPDGPKSAYKLEQLDSINNVFSSRSRDPKPSLSISSDIYKPAGFQQTTVAVNSNNLSAQIASNKNEYMGSKVYFADEEIAKLDLESLYENLFRLIDRCVEFNIIVSGSDNFNGIDSIFFPAFNLQDNSSYIQQFREVIRRTRIIHNYAQSNPPMFQQMIQSRLRYMPMEPIVHSIDLDLVMNGPNAIRTRLENFYSMHYIALDLVMNGPNAINTKLKSLYSTLTAISVHHKKNGNMQAFNYYSTLALIEDFNDFHGEGNDAALNVEQQ